jgi:methylenetetrahydrofolate reductase (NADPH)
MLASLLEPRGPVPGNDDVALAASVRRLFADWSIETTPRQAERIPSFEAMLPAGTRVNVAYVPDESDRAVVSTVRRLAASGMRPVPHVPARTMPSAAFLESYLAACAQAGACEALVIGGGVPRPRGPFDRSMQVLETGLLQALGYRRVGVAGHPEGSPDIAGHDLARALAEKNEFAAATGLELVIYTQFTFDAASVIRWREALAVAGNRLPIRIGVPGPASIKSLMRYAALCGVGSSLRFLSRRRGQVFQLMSQAEPDGFVVDLVRGVEGDAGGRIEGVHLYPFGGLEKAAAFARALAEGRFRLSRNGDGLDVAA